MATTSKNSPSAPSEQRQIWWSNAILFVGIHIAACVGVYCHPLYSTPRQTVALAVILWQVACFSVTIGYHRLYSHRAFVAGVKTRAILAVLGTSAFQGSIKWWVLRHRLHHRYTDDPVHDPYSASRGLLWSHVGWIFFKQHYERINLIDKEDLDEDPVVRFQHKFYTPIALTTAILFPTLVGTLWHDGMGAFIWAGLVARIAVWHCTFLVNSLAHWDGMQPYSDENTSRVNMVVALLTCGEGNHNFHASHSFPQDYRSGPSLYDWDPSKWIILGLHSVGLVTGLKQASAKDLSSARWRMHFKTHVASDSSPAASGPSESEFPEMSIPDLRAYFKHTAEDRCVLLIDRMVIDATLYLKEHPGGAALLRKYAVDPTCVLGCDSGDYINASQARATDAFYGGMNKHSQIARDKLRTLAIARLTRG